MQAGRLRAVVGRHLSDLRDEEDLVVPLSRDSITLVLGLLDELLRTFVQPAPAQSTGEAATVKKPKQKLDPETTQQRWQALFPNDPELAAGPATRARQCPLSLVDWCLTVLREDGGEVVEETKVAQHCARVLLGVASRIAEVGAMEVLNSKKAIHGVPPSMVKKAISEDPSLGPVFKDSPTLQVVPQSLAALCATLVVKYEVPYHDLGLPNEVVEAIAKKDKAATMRRLLGQIETTLATTLKTPLKLKPATDEEIAAAEKKFQLTFPPELRALLKWSNGVPMDAPGMMAFVQCAGLEEISEEFFYNDDFPTLFRKMKWIPIAPIDYDFCYNALDIKSGMVVQIDNECESALLISPSLIESVRAYADALEQHKDNVEVLKSEKDSEEEDGTMELSIQAPEIYAAYAGFDGEEDEDEDEDDNDDENAEEDGLNMRCLKEHKMTELRAFAKKHNIRVFGRMKDDVINAITTWRRNRKRETKKSLCRAQ